MYPLVVIEDHDGTRIEFEPVRFLPLTFSELVQSIDNGSRSFNFVCEVESVRKNGVDHPNLKRASFRIEFQEPLRLIALVPNGCLPVPFAPEKILADSNVIGQLGLINRGHDQMETRIAGWWINFLSNPGLEVNPLPYVLEGNTRTIPSIEQLREAYTNAAEQIRLAIPRASVTEFGDHHFEAAHDLLSNLLAKHEREISFLLGAVPLIVNAVAPARFEEIETELFRIAADEGLVPRSSLVVVACLSCLYENGAAGCSAARRLIKPRANYGRDEAYNGWTDLLTLQIYLGSLALSKKFGLEPYAFCTFDVALSMFWAGLDVGEVRLDPKAGLVVDYSLTEHLFSRLDGDGRLALATRMT